MTTSNDCNEAVFQNFMVRQHNSLQVGMKQNLYEEYIRSSETDRLRIGKSCNLE